MNTMTNTSPEQKSNRGFWIFIAVAAVVVIIAVVAGFLFAGNKGTASQEGPDGGNNAISEAPPTIVKVAATADKAQLVFNAETKQYKTDKWFLEYQLDDQDRKTVETGYATSPKFEVKTNIGDSAYYRLKVRLSDKKETSAWSDGYTIKLEKISGIKTLQPNDGYYSTPWAKGQGSRSNLDTALQVAYNANPISAAQTDRCIALNKGQMTPSLLLPPIPAVSPEGVLLSYTVSDWDDAKSEGTVAYYWC